MKWCFAILLALAIPATLDAQEGNSRGFTLEIEPQSRDEKYDLNELNRQALAEAFRIVVIDPKNREALSNLEIFTTDGREIMGRLAVALQNRVFILGTTVQGRELNISKIEEINGKIQIVFSAVDQQGRYVQISDRGEIFLFDSDGREICFKVESIRAAQLPIHVGVALDVSGSMHDYHDDLSLTLGSFLRALPPHAECTVIEFRSTHATRAGGRNGKALCSSASRILVSEPNGTTRIFPALKELYDQLNSRGDGLKLAIVISDGVSETNGYYEALNAKGEITTYINWLGSYDQGATLKEFADAQLYGSAEADGMMKEFFGQAGASVNKQFVATQCEAK